MDRRWDDFIAVDPRSSVFHRREWLEALALTYNYQPFALTSASENERLTDGAVFCFVSSWITGKRAVALPFSDHCDLLAGAQFTWSELQEWIQVECGNARLNYIEIRPGCSATDEPSRLSCTESYWLHRLDLAPDLDTLYSRLHKNSFQRRIRKAEKEVDYEIGNSEQFLDEFYGLVLKTRRRHQLIPQPKVWFKNLIQCFGDALKIRVARKDGITIAAILTLQHGSKMYYKYGASDDNFHNIGGTSFLFWKLIEESKIQGIREIDLGRSDLDQDGLITFKDRLGAEKHLLRYFRYSRTKDIIHKKSWPVHMAKHVFSILPDFVSPTLGSILYRHIS